MSPAQLVEALQAIAAQGWELAAPMRAAHAAGIPVAADDIEDHRAAVYAAVIDALNDAWPALGTALHTAMNPIALTKGTPS